VIAAAADGFDESVTTGAPVEVALVTTAPPGCKVTAFIPAAAAVAAAAPGFPASLVAWIACANVGAKVPLKIDTPPLKVTTV
jgi:hypothetical protein